MAVTINGRDVSEAPPPPEAPPPKPPKATKFVQLHSDGPESPLYALDSTGMAWQFVVKRKVSYSGETQSVERYWVPLPNERRAE